MGDRIDELMAKFRGDIDKAVAAGLGEKPKLDDYVRVEPFESPISLRVMSVGWKDGDPGLGSGVALQQFDPRVEGVWELRVNQDVQLDDLKNNTSAVLAQVKKFATSARQAERKAVLHLISENGNCESGYDLAKVKKGVEQLQGACRIIASDDIAAQAKKKGVVEEAVHPRQGLPSAAKAMLIRLAGGPAVRRVEGDLTLSWSRKTTNTVELHLSEQFFVDEVEHAITFQDP